MLHLKPYFLALPFCLLLLCACGQTGDLYLPEAAEPEEIESKKETSKN